MDHIMEYGDEVFDPECGSQDDSMEEYYQNCAYMCSGYVDDKKSGCINKCTPYQNTSNLCNFKIVKVSYNLVRKTSDLFTILYTKSQKNN